MECCGQHFGVGQETTLTTVPADGMESLATVLGYQRAAAVTDFEDHHSQLPIPGAAESKSLLTGTVESIEAIFCRYDTQGDRRYYPVAGTTQVGSREEVSREVALRESLHVPPGFRFVGYVVAMSTEQ